MTNHSEAWLSIREAALTLGTSELTIRRRIKDGRLKHKFENGKYFVSLNGPPTARVSEEQAVAEPAESSRGGDKPSAAVDLTRFLAEHTRLAETAGRAAFLEEQLRQLEQRNQELQAGLVSLASRNGWLESRLEDREREVRLLTDSRSRPSWWKRLFLGPQGSQS